MQPIKVSPVKIGALKYEFDKKEFVVPKFQRKFVWNRKSVCSLIDSVCKNYPIGSILLWDTDKKDIFKSSGNLPDLDQQNRYVKYVLDGQQRLTSFFGVLYGKKLINRQDTEIDCRKICLNLKEARKGFKDDIQLIEYYNANYLNYFPIYELIDFDRFLEITKDLSEEDKKIIQTIHSNIINYEIPFIQMSSSDTEGICESFVRINDRGTKLNTVNLVMATAWSESFDLQSEVDSFQEELRLNNWYIKEEHIIQTVSLILKNSISKSTQVKLKIEDIQQEWKNIKKSIKLALDYFRSSLGVKTEVFLPFGVMLPILAYFYHKNSFKAPNAIQDKTIKNWFWQSAFAERFSGSGYTGYVVEDKKKMDMLIMGKKVSIDYKQEISENKFKQKLIKTTLTRLSSVKSAFLCMLALEKPCDFRNGNEIVLDNSVIEALNDKQKHHIFPYAYLKKQEYNDYEINSILNICFLPAYLNNSISDKKPSDYMSEFKNERNFPQILKSHLLKEKESAIWSDNYHDFLEERSEIALEKIKSLIGELSRLEEDLKDDPNSVIEELEQEIRTFLDGELSYAYGRDYWKEAIPGDVQDKIKTRIQVDLAKNPSLANSFDTRKKLSYCDVSEYLSIIMNNWNIFEKYFLNKHHTQNYFNFLSDYRNAVKHSREVDKFVQKQGEIAIEWIFNIVRPDYQED